MADDDADGGEAPRPSLEPPKLFRRRKKAAAPPAPDASAPGRVEPAEPAETAAAPADAADETEVVDDPVVEDSGVEDSGVEDSGPEDPVAEPVADDPADRDEVVVAAPEAEAAPAPEPDPEPEPEPEPAPEPEPEPAAEEPGFTDAATVPVHVGGDHDERSPDPAPEASEDPGDETGDDAPAAPREPRAPVLVGRTAALLAGFLVGVLLLLLGAGATTTCEAVRGTSACGAALGLPLLAVVVALGVVAGALLLRLWHLPSPGSTSFMAVALVAVVAGLFLGEALESWVTRIAFPFGVALAYLAAWWLTVSFDDPEVVRRAREERERQQV